MGRAIVAFIVFVVLMLLFFLFGGRFAVPEQGEKIGEVIKLSRGGAICKTWEAQLIRGGMNGGSGAFGVAPFDFTIESDAVAQQVDRYLQHHAQVLITYETRRFYNACS